MGVSRYPDQYQGYLIIILRCYTRADAIWKTHRKEGLHLHEDIKRDGSRLIVTGS